MPYTRNSQYSSFSRKKSFFEILCDGQFSCSHYFVLWIDNSCRVLFGLESAIIITADAIIAATGYIFGTAQFYGFPLSISAIGRQFILQLHLSYYQGPFFLLDPMRE
jgi:hypothetical protein